jgi:hypothetical protein
LVIMVDARDLAIMSVGPKTRASRRRSLRAILCDAARARLAAAGGDAA